MTRSIATASVAVMLIGLAAREGTAEAQPSPTLAPADGASTQAFPFYDAEGAKLPPAPPPKRSHLAIVAAGIDLGELFVPALASGGVLVSPMIEAGNDVVSGGAGYANLAGASGVDFDVSLALWGSSVPMFDSRGWLGSWLLPNVSTRFAYFPGQAGVPSWILGATTTVAGIRFARCFQGLSFEMSAAGVAGPMLVEINRVYGGIEVGGHLDFGFAFWR